MVTSVEDQFCWSGVGMLLFLMKHSRSHITHATRELLKANDGMNHAAFCKLIQVLRYALITKNFGLKLEPLCDARKLWEIVCFSNSNYAGDPISRKSVSGYPMCNCFLAIKSKANHDAV